MYIWRTLVRRAVAHSVRTSFIQTNRVNSLYNHASGHYLQCPDRQTIGAGLSKLPLPDEPSEDQATRVNAQQH